MDRYAFGWMMLLIPAISVAGLLAQGGVPGMAPPGKTAQATLYAFDTAALQDDEPTILGLCDPEGDEEVLAVARIIQAEGRTVAWSYSWRRLGVAAQQPGDVETWGKEVSGRLVQLDLEAGTWRIVRGAVD